MPSAATAFRPVSSIDVAAVCAAFVLPAGWRPRIDQTRLDLQAIVDSFRGKRPVTFRTRQRPPLQPTPLSAVDPMAFVLPQSLSESYLRLRRDMRFLSNELRGLHPPPVIPTKATSHRHRGPEASALRPRIYRVTQVQRPFPDAVTLQLEAPPALEAFLPGQFITLFVEIDGKAYRRAYSLCSTPQDLPRATITIKRVAGGVVSNHLINTVREGDLLRALGPSGSFTAPLALAEGHVVLLAAGSGITPILSIARSLLERTQGPRVSLLYGNRSGAGVLFLHEIEGLARAHPERFRVHHVLSQPDDRWEGPRGRLDAERLPTLLDAVGASDRDRYYVCGPAGMMQAAEQSLMARGVPASHVHEERFLSPQQAGGVERLADKPVEVTITGRTQGRRFLVPPDKTLLEAALGEGVALSFSCSMGGCAACKVRLRRGAVRMDEPNALNAQERDEGYILACIAHPTEPCEVETA